ncbi:S49 family peptidase [Limnohabitans sp. Rim8]|jgi:signal peptide peptidase SppA|uniref:S49 family peptidase n=1 Tax=Limnohabitans sp. Rim8 TaxID=1100718 RepID=UPI000D366648|nr:S49 family peptidase [Limnohabitans sp. Rim8]
MTNLPTMPYLASRVFGTPLLIHPRKLEVILSVVGARMGMVVPETSAQLAQISPPERVMRSDLQVPNIAVISILGTLVRRTGAMDAASGLTSYASISAQINAAINDPNVDAVLLDIDSPGGEAGGAFDLADEIVSARSTKPIWALANDDAFSAAYAIACSAERIYLTRTGGVGSIGVIALHVDQTQRDALDGYRYTAIYAGDRKNDLSPHLPLSNEASTALQTEVDRLYEMFVSTVATNRGLDAQAVRDTQAGLFYAGDAIEAGFADAIGTADDALRALAIEVQQRKSAIARSFGSGREMEVSLPDPVLSKEKLMSQTSPPASTASTEAVPVTSTVVTPEDANPQAPHQAPHQETESPAGADAQKDETTEMVQSAVATATAASHDIRKASANVLAVAEMCLLAGKSDMTFSALERGLSVEQVRNELLAAKASDSPEISSHILPQAGTQTTTKPEQSPVVIAAQQRAQKLAANRPSYKSN